MDDDHSDEWVREQVQLGSQKSCGFFGENHAPFLNKKRRFYEKNGDFTVKSAFFVQKRRMIFIKNAD